jgi:hypothetical protein
VTSRFKNVKFILAGPVRSISFKKEIDSFITKEGLHNFIDMPNGVYGIKKKSYTSIAIFSFSGLMMKHLA